MVNLSDTYVLISVKPESLESFKSALARIIASGSGLEHTAPAIEAALSGDKSVELPDLDPFEVLRANADSVKELLERLEFTVEPYEGGGEQIGEPDGDPILALFRSLSQFTETA